MIPDSSDIANSILEETKDGGYQTLFIGRCGPFASLDAQPLHPRFIFLWAGKLSRIYERPFSHMRR